MKKKYIVKFTAGGRKRQRTVMAGSKVDAVDYIMNIWHKVFQKDLRNGMPMFAQWLKIISCNEVKFGKQKEQK
jgi:hypothetical protein